jgi:hypothetical protein
MYTWSKSACVVPQNLLDAVIVLARSAARSRILEKVILYL